MEAGKCKLFFSDLDGTLIFSARHRKNTDIVIERKNGEEITCITEKQAELLPKLSDKIIPLTSRSIEQYKRIEIKGFSPKYALCANGGVLLVDGIADEEWLSESQRICSEASVELERFRYVLENDNHRNFEIRMVDGLFLFTKSECPESTLELLGTGEMCDCFATGQKVYVVPKALGKGKSVERFVKRFSPNGAEIICAGDSLMDVSMLNYAYRAVFTENIPLGMVSAQQKITHSKEGFSLFVTECISELFI